MLNSIDFYSHWAYIETPLLSLGLIILKFLQNASDKVLMKDWWISLSENTFENDCVPFRMFDSQNNNRGGYNVGSLYYYAGSVLPLEWTNQHSCADPNSNCEIVIQYMCDSKLRDGTSTTWVSHLNALVFYHKLSITLTFPLRFCILQD